MGAPARSEDGPDAADTHLASLATGTTVLYWEMKSLYNFDICEYYLVLCVLNRTYNEPGICLINAF